MKGYSTKRAGKAAEFRGNFIKKITKSVDRAGSAMANKLTYQTGEPDIFVGGGQKTALHGL